MGQIGFDGTIFPDSAGFTETYSVAFKSHERLSAALFMHVLASSST